MNKFGWILNEKSRDDYCKISTKFLGKEEMFKVKSFHESINYYNKTPLVNLKKLSGYLGISGLYIKDESYRFGLNAFKVLGGSYAIAKCLAKRLDLDISEITFDMLKTEEVRRKLGDITFTTATDGNHGRGIAWMAQQLGFKSVIYMPKGSTMTRLQNIGETGAQVYITDFNYDDTVRMAAENAEKYGWEIIQDTIWEGYEDVPRSVMQGYTTMALEALEQLNSLGDEKPTHVFLQAGVGSMAAAVVGMLNSMYGKERPITVIVEPDKADCIFKSAEAGDGSPIKVGGDLNTIMAGLACGEPNPLGWDILKDYCDMFVSVPDYVSARGMRILGNPLEDDIKVISGESGAVTMGFLSTIMQIEYYAEMRNALKLDSSSRVLLFSTEGDTDPGVYRGIVWDGNYPSTQDRR